MWKNFPLIVQLQYHELIMFSRMNCRRGEERVRVINAHKLWEIYENYVKILYFFLILLVFGTELGTENIKTFVSN